MDTFVIAEMIMSGMRNETIDRTSAQRFLFGQFVVLTNAEIDNLLDMMWCNGMLTHIGSNPNPYRLVYIVNKEW